MDQFLGQFLGSLRRQPGAGKVAGHHQRQPAHLCHLPQLLHNRAQRRADGGGRQVDVTDGGLQPRQIEQVVHQRQHALAGAVDVAEHLMQPGVGAAARTAQLREAQDALQRRAQLVADVGQKLALGGVGMLGRVLGLQRALGGLSELGHIGQATDHAGDLATGVGERHHPDHHVARQAVAVENLLFVVGRQARCDGDLLLHLVRRGQLRRVQPAQVDADHALGGQAGEIGPGFVDAHKAAGRVFDHHRDRADLEKPVGESVLGRQVAACGGQVTAHHFAAAQAAPDQHAQRAQQRQQAAGGGGHRQRGAAQLGVERGLGGLDHHHQRLAARAAECGVGGRAVQARAKKCALCAAGQDRADRPVRRRPLAGRQPHARAGGDELAVLGQQRGALGRVAQQQGVLGRKVVGVDGGHQPVGLRPGAQRAHQRQQVGARRAGVHRTRIRTRIRIRTRRHTSPRTRPRTRRHHALQVGIGQVGQIEPGQQRPQPGLRRWAQQVLAHHQPAQVGAVGAGQHAAMGIDQADAAQERQCLHGPQQPG